MNILIVAHYSADLVDLLDEVAVAASSMQATLVLGAVTERMIADKTRGKKFDLVIFTGHGTADGYVLDDGFLSAQAIASYMRRWDTKELILNCCCSWRWVPVIQRVGDIEIVAANTDTLDDRDAWRAMEDILHGLSEGDDLRISAESSTSHSYWGLGGVKLEERASMSDYNQYIRALEILVNELKVEIVRRDAATDARLSTMERKIDGLQEQLARYQKQAETTQAQVQSIDQKVIDRLTESVTITRETFAYVLLFVLIAFVAIWYLSGVAANGGGVG